MSYFDDTISAYLEKATVRAAYFVKFDFTPTPMYVWNGFGNIISGGHTWEGIGKLASIDGIEAAVNGNAPQMKLSVSGVDTDIIALALGEESAYANRLVTIYLQFMTEKWKPLDSPYALQSGLMDVPEITLGPADSDGSRTNVISIPAESVFYARNNASYGSYTTADQTRRFPGDKFFDNVISLQQKVIRWPTF